MRLLSRIPIQPGDCWKCWLTLGRNQKHAPRWNTDATAIMLGVARFGCPRCGRKAIKERDARDHE